MKKVTYIGSTRRSADAIVVDRVRLIRGEAIEVEDSVASLCESLSGHNFEISGGRSSSKSKSATKESSEDKPSQDDESTDE